MNKAASDVHVIAGQTPSSMRGRKPKAVVIVGLVAVGAIVLALAFTSASTVGAPNRTPTITRQQVLDATRSKTSIVARADRMDAKLTTWGILQTARGASADVVTSMQPAQQVWVVAVGGDFVPQLGRGEHFSVGCHHLRCQHW